ncbi:MAG: MFS transporter [Halobacteriovoraceae bacterium]|nr:MFS transporter [Halobacteriovoraceae bacterium]
MFEILKKPNYRKLYIASSISELGSFVTDMALTVFLFELSNKDNSILGINRAVFLSFYTLGTMLGGVSAEKINRKKILLFCEFIRFPVVLCLLFWQNVSLVIFINGFIGLFTGLFNPARQAMINDMIPPIQMNQANSLFGSTMAILHLVAPLIGPVWYSYSKSINEIIIFDLITYAFGIFLLLKLVYRPPSHQEKNKKETSKFFHDLKEGAIFISKRPDLKAMFMNSVITGLCIGVLIPLLLPYLNEEFSKGSAEYGYLLGAFGVGGIFGGPLCSFLSRKIKTGPLTIYSVMAEPFFMFFWLLSSNLYLSMLVFAVWGVVVIFRITAHLNYISQSVEGNYLARLHSLLDLSFVFPNVTGGILIGFIGDYYPASNILWITLAFFAFFIFIRLPSSNMKALFKGIEGQVYRDENSFDQA